MLHVDVCETWGDDDEDGGGGGGGGADAQLGESQQEYVGSHTHPLHPLPPPLCSLIIILQAVCNRSVPPHASLCLPRA